MFKNRMRVILIVLFGGFLMVATRLFYLQVVMGDYYRDYAENVCVETRATESGRGTIRGAGGELLAFEQPSFDIAMVPDELPERQALCRPVLQLYALARRERIAAVRDVAVMVRGGANGAGYEVSVGLAAKFLRLSGTDLVEKEEHGTALVVVPRKTAAVAEAVAALANTSAKEMLNGFFEGLALVGRGWQRLGDPCVVARDVGFLAAAEVETNPERYPGFRAVARPRRSYPYDSLAAHVLGYVQRVSASEYDRWHESYGGSAAKRFLPDDLIGRSGIERAFDLDLRPARGTQTVEVDAARRTQRVLEDNPAQPGADVYLTIDREVQSAAEAALEGHIGAIILLETASGRVLAMASSPTYNPNELPVKPPDPADRTAPMWNRAIQGQYPLGSAFKLIEAVGALEENKAPASVECTGSYLGHGCGNHSVPMHVDFEDALKRSCNSYFYRTAHEMLGIRGVAKWGALFGLGQPTGISLPSEKGGILPNPAWKRREHGEEWFAGDTCNLAIGQGYLAVTPLQVVRFVAAIANGGRLVRPRLVEKIVRPDGSAETPDDGAGCETLPLTPARLERVHRVMRSVCHELGGTARKAFARSEAQPDWVADQGYEVAGKTSTAQRGGAAGNVLWFTGFAPYGSPRVAFVVMLENQPKELHGGEVAAPIARRVLERLPERCLEGVPGKELRQRARERLTQKGAAQ
ncbi:MAG: hypothetical protein FJ291_26010 [Planctomycetes bacterium]|nr:hypothetical protein [Planctomycetota bacterium]